MQETKFGNTADNREVKLFHFENSNGMKMSVTNYGGIITSLQVPDKKGVFKDVVLGFDDLESYFKGHPYFGAITGRVAGRLTKGEFSLGGKAFSLVKNDQSNHLHGGILGFDKKLWRSKTSVENGLDVLELAYTSPDGEEGYPGDVEVFVKYSLSEENELKIEYQAKTNKSTPICLTNHSYFNLSGEGQGRMLNHELQIFADSYTPTDEEMTLKGTVEPVENQPNDFRKPKKLGSVIDKLWQEHGDHYWLNHSGKNSLDLVAKVREPKSGRKMLVYSTAPCLQLYTGKFLDGTLIGKSGSPYEAFGAFCLECQDYPDGVNKPKLGSGILNPGSIYKQTTIYQFSA